MINPQALISQILMSNQPQQAIINLLSPQQLQLFNQLNNKPSKEQAAAIAQMCNERGITQEQLAQILNLARGKR